MLLTTTTTESEEDIRATAAAIGKGQVTIKTRHRLLPNKRKFTPPVNLGYEKTDRAQVDNCYSPFSFRRQPTAGYRDH